MFDRFLTIVVVIILGVVGLCYANGSISAGMAKHVSADE